MATAASAKEMFVVNSMLETDQARAHWSARDAEKSSVGSAIRVNGNTVRDATTMIEATFEHCAVTVLWQDAQKAGMEQNTCLITNL